MIPTALLVAALLLVGASPPPADFTAYVEEIRAAGATESAQSDLGGLALTIVGQYILGFPKGEDGKYSGFSYRAISCPRPGMAKEELDLWKRQMDAKQKPVMAKLKLLADTDHSGFVTTKEASELRSAVEFGLKIVFLAAKETADPVRLQKLTVENERDFRLKLRRYQDTVASLAGVAPDVLGPLPSNLTAKAGAGV